MNVARGDFTVNIVPSSSEQGPISHLTLDKRFSGGLEATSRGQMLSTVTPVHGSAGYVAIETVTGTLEGRSGSFALQHNGLMDRGEGKLTIAVVPDSGTDELTGLTGKMSIRVDPDGGHHYELSYRIEP